MLFDSFPTRDINSDCPVAHGGNVLQCAQFLPGGRAEGSAMKEEDMMYWRQTRGNCLSVQYIHILCQRKHRLTTGFIILSNYSLPYEVEYVFRSLGLFSVRISRCSVWVPEDSAWSHPLLSLASEYPFSAYGLQASGPN